MSDCIFCRIISGQAPASVVYLDGVVTAFLDIQPVNPGHVLVVPNGHAAYLADLDEAVGGKLFRWGCGWPRRCAGAGYGVKGSTCSWPTVKRRCRKCSMSTSM